jgi:hypothetical protein
MRLNKSFVTAILIALFFTNIFAQVASSTSPAETKIESPGDLFLGRNFLTHPLSAAEIQKLEAMEKSLLTGLPEGEFNSEQIKKFLSGKKVEGLKDTTLGLLPTVSYFLKNGMVVTVDIKKYVAQGTWAVRESQINKGRGLMDLELKGERDVKQSYVLKRNANKLTIEGRDGARTYVE